jgi:hypothetical protein
VTSCLFLDNLLSLVIFWKVYLGLHDFGHFGIYSFIFASSWAYKFSLALGQDFCVLLLGIGQHWQPHVGECHYGPILLPGGFVFLKFSKCKWKIKKQNKPQVGPVFA